MVDLIKLMEELNLSVSWVSIFLSIIPVVGWVIKIWTKAPLELLLVPKHKKIFHEISMAIILSVPMVVILAFLSFQLLVYISPSMFSIAGNIFMLIFLLIVVFMVSHNILLEFFYKGSVKHVSKIIYRLIIIFGLVSLIILIICANSLLIHSQITQDEVNQETQDEVNQETLNEVNQETLNEALLIIIMEIIIIIVAILTIPNYLKKIERTGFYFEIDILQGEEGVNSLKGMIYQYSIKKGIQVMTLPDTKGKDPLTLDTFYVFYLELNLVQKIKKNSIL